MTYDLKDKTAVVTGSGKKSGIGYGIVRKLAACGANVVNAICPGVIQTDFTDWRFKLEADILNSTVAEREAEMLKTIPMGRLGTSAEVANLVAFLASGQSSYITGQAINITGGQLMEI